MGKLLGVIAMAVVVGAALLVFGQPQQGPSVRISTLESLSAKTAADAVSPIVSDGGSRRLRQVNAGPQTAGCVGVCLPDQIDMSGLPPLDRPGT
ncbi:MAG TPA: hypothetical protein VNS02_09920 [Rhizobiaceae bacterium]|nr:hypothetical protein [Rhizobiaceae bacterium]